MKRNEEDNAKKKFLVIDLLEDFSNYNPDITGIAGEAGVSRKFVRDVYSRLNNNFIFFLVKKERTVKKVY